MTPTLRKHLDLPETHFSCRRSGFARIMGLKAQSIYYFKAANSNSMKLSGLLIVAAFFSCTSSRQATGNSATGQPQSISPDTLTRDTVLQFSARPDLGFNFSYLVYLPKGLQRNRLAYLLVETTNTGANDSIEHHEKGARYAAARSSVGNYIARKLKIPLLVPIFPRPATNWMYYTHALDRDAFLSKEFGIERLDLQLLAMIGDAKNKLSGNWLPLKEKFFITGFSASGTFANRFSILHPEKIAATASGGINAIAILPVAQLNGKALDYPLGIADIEKVTGKKVNLKAFRQLPKMLYMGEKDDNDAAAYDDGYSQEERQLIYDLMGKQMIPQRWEFIQLIYGQNKVQADFRTYSHMGHGTDLKINTDLVEFFRKYMTP